MSAARKRLAGSRALPYVALALVVCASIASRAIRLEQPCDAPCSTPFAHGLIFDEAYYVNAARRIAERPSEPTQLEYAEAPAGTDPNAEHPQLAKVAMAAGMELFGDRPLGYRIGSVVAGTLALLGLFALVRAAGGGPWLGVAAAAVLALDNLFVVHGRIATLDIYVLAFMLVGVALYVRDRPLLAGVLLGVGATAKLVGIYALFIVGVLELGRRAVERGRDSPTRRHPPLEALAMCIVATLATYAVGLQLLDLAVPAFDPGTGERLNNVVDHTRHMLDYAVQITSPAGPEGIASYPWTWLVGGGAIPYLTIEDQVTADGEVIATATAIAFKGALNPFLLFVAIPALFAAAARAGRDADELDLVALAWFAGTFVPFTVQALFQDRTTYVYYLLATLPGLCIAAVRLFSAPGVPRAAAVGWAVALVIGFVELFPFRTLL